MIEEIVKRDGSIEPFSPRKLNGWGEWASKALGQDVNWSEVVLHVASTSNPQVTSKELQKAFIDYCLTKRSFAYNRMAGRLYISMLYKEIYNEVMPTLKELLVDLSNKGLVSKSFVKAYSDEEYEQLNSLIDHKSDMSYAHYQIEQAMEKYSIRDRVKGGYLETPQYSAMRVAMQMCKNRKNRINRIKRHYDKIRSDVLNVPTPYYTNSGTDKLGLASCCLHESDDDVGSLSTGNHISYMMTVNSAGQGTKIRTRTINDPVRGGTIPHQGKKPYLRAEVGMINANLQNGRGGAETTSFDILDPEIKELLVLKNPMTPSARQIRGLDYSIGFNKYFAEKAAKNEDWVLFSYNDVPDLYEALYSTDDTFEKLYNKYVKQGLGREVVKARDVLRLMLTEGVGVGRIYQENLYEMNHHTPFKTDGSVNHGKVRQSNLCVAPETELLTRNGYETISKLEGKTVEVWNGKEWSETTVVKTGENQELFEVIVRVSINGSEFFEKSLFCTAYHKWYDTHGNEKRTHELELNTELLKWFDESGNEVFSYVSEIKDDGRHDSTYCVNEPLHHKAVFNGILTGQCLEIGLITQAYKSVSELYIYGDLKEAIKNKAHPSVIKYLEDKNSKVEGEVAVCSLAGINVGKIKGKVGTPEWDEEYREAAFVALDMVYTAIQESEYPLPHIEYTAKKRMSAGVGIVDLAHLMAKYKLTYDSQEGRDLIHKVAESHYWHLLNASLELSKEFGNAEWMDKTKWVDGWLPIDTYNRHVDEVVTVGNQYDWEGLRKKIIDNGGHAFSVLAAHMPAESSSVRSGSTNGVYPVRDLDLNKSNDTNVVKYVVPESDKLGKYYQNAYDISVEDMAKVYGIIQKWTDQAISADQWYKAQGSDKIKSSELMKGWFSRVYYGVKTRYYINTLTAKGIDLNVDDMVDEDSEYQPESNPDCEECRM